MNNLDIYVRMEDKVEYVAHAVKGARMEIKDNLKA